MVLYLPYYFQFGFRWLKTEMKFGSVCLFISRVETMLKLSNGGCKTISSFFSLILFGIVKRPFVDVCCILFGKQKPYLVKEYYKDKHVVQHFQIATFISHSDVIFYHAAVCLAVSFYNTQSQRQYKTLPKTPFISLKMNSNKWLRYYILPLLLLLACEHSFISKNDKKIICLYFMCSLWMADECAH